MTGYEQTQERLVSAIGDRYDTLQWIGRGGMADVFLVRHRLHGGFCAVKVLADHLAQDSNIVKHFLQEARTAANLEGHPNVVRIVDIGESQGLYYLIMQYIEGEDLAAYIEHRGRLPATEAIWIAGQIAEALVWSHARGVVHRDLKPGNVRLDPAGRVIVLDFGIAKIGSVPTMLTQMGFRVGTPHYMAPEQIRGERCDGRIDLYALGVILFQLLTGQKPFVGETTEDVWHGHLHTPPPDLKTLDPSLSPGLASVVRRLLEKDPADRYQTPKEVIDDLRELGYGEAPPSLQPALSLDLNTWRQTEPQSPVEFGQRRNGADVAPTARVAEPVRSEPPPAREPEPEKQRETSVWPLVAGGMGLAALALAAGLYYGLRSPTGAVLPDAKDPVVEDAAGLQERISTPTGMMRLIPAGEFAFGHEAPESPNPPQTIQLGDFYIDATEVSNAAYRLFCDGTGRPHPDAPDWDPNYFLGKSDFPVVNVSFDDAQAYAQWAGKRLPSEQEWEKAARGQQGSAFPWGNEGPEGKANVQGAQDGFENAAPVTAFPEGASSYGILNMSGNVWEITASAYPVMAQEIADMKRALQSEVDSNWIVAKGGSFVSLVEDIDLRSFMRAGFPVDAKSPYIGFRCAKNAK